jgi:hypothetical protein
MAAPPPPVARFLVVDLFSGEGGAFSGTAEAMLGKMRQPLRGGRGPEVEIGAVLSADASADIAAAHRAVQGALKERFGSSWETLAWPVEEEHGQARRREAPRPPCSSSAWLGSNCQDWTPQATAMYIMAVARHHCCTHLVILGSPSRSDLSGADLLLLSHQELAGTEAALSVHWLLSVVHLVSCAVDADQTAPRLAWWSVEHVSSIYVARALHVWTDASPHIAWARVPMHLCCDGRTQERRFRIFAGPGPLLPLILRADRAGSHVHSGVSKRTWEQLLELEPELTAAASERNPPRLASGRVCISKRHRNPSGAHRVGKDLLPTFTAAGAELWLREVPRAGGTGGPTRNCRPMSTHSRWPCLGAGPLRRRRQRMRS